MANIDRLRVAWSGAPVVGAGLSTFYFGPGHGAGMPGAVKAFFTAIKATVPGGVTWTIPNGGDTIDDTSGTLVGAWTDTGGGTVTSGGTGVNFALGVGGRIVWETAGIFKGRRVRGSTFIVPLVIDYFEGAGAISSVALTNWAGSAAALISAAPSLRVWSRPSGGVAGASSTVTSATTPDAVSWLRGRRT